MWITFAISVARPCGRIEQEAEAFCAWDRHGAQVRREAIPRLLFTCSTMKTGHYLGHYHWVGADVAKNTFDAALVLAHQHFPATQLRDIPVRTFPRSEKGVSDFIQWLDTFELSDASVRVMMESTGSFSTELCAWMLKQRDSLSPAIETARYTAHYLKSMGLRNKTDRLEARALGFYGIERNPRPYTKPAPEYLELPQLSRYRDNLVHQQTHLKNQTHETTTAFIKHEQQKQLTRLKKDITRVEKAMKDLIKKHDKLAHDIDLLTTIYGIAFISAVTLVAELGDLRRFDKARQLTALSGLSPRQHQSGTRVYRQSRICKQGNPRVHQILYLSAMVAVRGNNQFRTTYQKLIHQGNPKMVALIAIMRKLLILMRAILITGKPYQPMGITR